MNLKLFAVTKEALCPQLAISPSVKIVFLKLPGRLLFSFSKANHQTEGASSYLHCLNITFLPFFHLRLFMIVLISNDTYSKLTLLRLFCSCVFVRNCMKIVSLEIRSIYTRTLTPAGYFSMWVLCNQQRIPIDRSHRAIPHWCVCWYKQNHSFEKH